MAAFVLLLSAAGASAAELDPPRFDPVLSLTGDCTESEIDPVKDPSCPYDPPPAGPSGRFNRARSIAIDAYGNEYVAAFAEDGSQGRIDVFDDEGKFITEIVDPNRPSSVAVDSKGNLYVFEFLSSGKEIVRYSPSLYEPEAGNIEYGNPRVVIETSISISNGLAIDFDSDRLFVAQGVQIKEFGSAAEGNVLLNTLTPQNALSGKQLSWANWAAVDAQRDRLYVSSCKNGIFECGILAFESKAPYAFIGETYGAGVPAKKFFSSKGWLSIAVDEETGNFFVDDLEAKDFVYEFDEDFQFVSRLEFAPFAGGNALQIAVSNSPLDEEAFNRGYLFVPTVVPDGRALAFKRDALPPEVEDLAATGIGETEAELQATVTPRGLDTEYVFKYVTEQEFGQTGFANATVGGSGTIPGESIATPVSAVIAGLTPGTAYRFQVFAENLVGDAEEEAGFATYSDAPGSDACPNQLFRIGSSAGLPDCRAYELVTPPDTNGHPPKGSGFSGDRFATLQSSPLGDLVSYTFEGGGLPGQEVTGAVNGDPYLATRGPSGWGTTATGPSGAETTVTRAGGVSPDQGHLFWEADEAGSAVLNGKDASYVRYPDGHSALIGRGSLNDDQQADGKLITENGTHIVFETSDTVGIQLEPDAPPSGTGAVYDRTADEVTHVVSLLPGNITPAAGKNAVYLGASPDGDGIAFSIGTDLYLRVDNSITYEIGGDVDEIILAAESYPAFAGVSEGGDRVFYLEDEDLLAFDTSSEEVIEFSQSGDVTVVNVAPDGNRAYFVSPSVLTGEPNPNGAVAQAGEQNLYLSEEGEISFVATVTDRDVEGRQDQFGGQVDGLGLWFRALIQRQTGLNPSRLTPEGSVFLFQSRANLDGYDPGGFPQVYRYDSVGDRLHCISCIPTKGPAEGGARLQTPAYSTLTPPPLSGFGFVPNLRADGRRAFFESEEALVSYDTNGVQDVYEWEEQGVGSCTRPGGCVYLISSGQGERDNFLYGHSASGDDVFFTTGDVLTGTDAGGTPSIYDARVGGGFPEPAPLVCQGEGCHPGLTLPPALSAPESGARTQSGNVTAKGKRCPKSKRKVKRKGKVVCVKKKQGKKQKKSQKAGKSRGAGK